MRQEEQSRIVPKAIPLEEKRVWIEPAIVLERSLSASAQSPWPSDVGPQIGPSPFGPYGVLGISGNPE